MSILSDYIAVAKSTAQPEAYDYEYLIPGLLGEVGEVFGQIAKAKWHGWSAEKLETELVAEYGDICWMTAILIDFRDSRGEEPQVTPPYVYGEQSPFSGMRRIQGLTAYVVDTLDREDIAADRVNKFVEAHTGTSEEPEFFKLADSYDSAKHYVDRALMLLWVNLEVYAVQVTGHPIQKSLDYNAEKLASRAARGVLRGAGDHR